VLDEMLSISTQSSKQQDGTVETLQKLYNEIEHQWEGCKALSESAKVYSNVLDTIHILKDEAKEALSRHPQSSRPVDDTDAKHLPAKREIQ
jgi:hypothetical protein